MQLVSTVTVGAGGASSISFSGIPQTGTDLLVVFSLRATGGDAISDIYPQLNSDTTYSNYTDRMLNGNGSSAQSQIITLPYAWINGNTSTANTFGNGTIYVPNYTSSSSKSMSIDAVTENNASEAFQSMQAVRYSPTTAITSIRLSGGLAFAQYSTASLYIITKA
jgi:hypothetical protein